MAGALWSDSVGLPRKLSRNTLGRQGYSWSIMHGYHCSWCRAMVCRIG